VTDLEKLVYIDIALSDRFAALFLRAKTQEERTKAMHEYQEVRSFVSTKTDAELTKIGDS
jgi:hypothetical protein